MAKETKTAGKTATVEVTAENVMDVIKEGNLGNQEMTQAVKDEIQKEKDDRKKYELKRRYLGSDHMLKTSLLNERHQNRMLQIGKYKRAQAGRLSRFLMGFTVTEDTIKYASIPDDICEIETVDKDKKTFTIVTDKKSGKKETYKLGDVVPPVITIIEYDNFVKTLKDKIANKVDAENKIYNNENNELDLSFGEYYTPSWRCRW